MVTAVNVFDLDKIFVFFLLLFGKSLLWPRILGGTGVFLSRGQTNTDTANAAVSCCEALTTAQRCPPRSAPRQKPNLPLVNSGCTSFFTPSTAHMILWLLCVIISNLLWQNKSTHLRIAGVPKLFHWLIVYFKILWIWVFTLGWMKTVLFLRWFSLRASNTHRNVSTVTAVHMKKHASLLIKTEIDLCLVTEEKFQNILVSAEFTSSSSATRWT